MNRCPHCLGVIGRDCFNTQECGEITRDMELRSRQGESPSGTTSEPGLQQTRKPGESPALSSNERTHDLKTWPDFFEPMLNGWKTFEIRKDDRGFRVHDTLLLREWKPTSKEYTGREIRKRVTYVISGSAWGLMKDYVVMGLAETAPKTPAGKLLGVEIEPPCSCGAAGGFDPLCWHHGHASRVETSPKFAYYPGCEPLVWEMPTGAPETSAPPFPIRPRQAMQSDESYVLSNLHTAAFLLDQRSAGETTAPQWRPVGDEPRDVALLCYWLPIDRYGDPVTSTATHSSIGDGWHRPERGSDHLRTPAYWMPLPASPVKATAPTSDVDDTPEHLRKQGYRSGKSP